VTRASATGALLALAVAGACKDRSDKPPPAPRPATPATLDKLDVVFDGARVVMAKAYVKQLVIEGRFQVYLTSKGGSCAELLANVFNRHDEQTLLFNIGDRLAPDGKLTTIVTDVFIRGSGTVQPGATARLVGTAEKGKPVEVTVDFAATAGDDKYTAKGSFFAEGCGADEPPTFGVPKAKHPSTATLTLAGKKLPIASALRVGRDQTWATGSPRTRNYILSTGPKDCSSAFPPAAIVLRREGARWYAEGESLGTSITNSSPIDKSGQPETRNITVTPGKPGKSDDGETIELVLGGSGTIGTYPFGLDGTIEALDCPER
jgi:hypothetical protein